MTSTLTGTKVRNTYGQVLMVDGGVTLTEAVVRDGDGTASALSVGTSTVSVDNLRFDGNTISSLDTNGNITLAPNGSGLVAIANVAITGGSIVGITDLAVADGGTGASTASGARTNLGLGTLAVQDANNVSITGGSMSGVTLTGSYSGITLVSATNVKATSELGYTTGAGGTVTQGTSKSTGVTLNKSSGQITMHNASLNNATAVSFTLTNSQISANDGVITTIASGATAGAYDLTVDAVGSGSCRVTLYNRSGGALGEAVVFNFQVVKGVTS